VKSEEDRGAGGVMDGTNTLAQLPNSWVWTSIAEIADTSSGGTPRRGRRDFFGGSIPWVKSGELRDGLVFHTEESITELGLRSSSAKVFPTGTLCLALYGATVGKLGLLGIDAATNQAVCGILVPDLIATHYLFHFLFSRRRKLIELSKGGAQPNISQDIVRREVVPLPPLAEQHRIVAKIEELFTKLDSGVEALRTARAQLKRYRQAVLKAAVTGELTKQWREAHQAELEPASELLGRMLKERREKWEVNQLARMKEAHDDPKNSEWKRRYKPPAELFNLSLPLVPEGWSWVSADQICSQITDGEHIQPRYQDEGFPMLTAKNVRDGYVDFSDVGYIADRDFRNCLKRCAPQENDILIVSVGATTGRAAIVSDVAPFAIVRSVLMLRPLVCPRYLLSCVQSSWCQTWISRASGSSAQAHLYILDTRKMPVPIPSLAEQQIIVDEVERLLSITDAVMQAIEQSLKQTERMRQSILKKAFEGKLVPQDPNDEPAELLLERIKTERAKREAEKSAASKSNRKRLTKKQNKRPGATA
jgi:type I restriction enzyme, S subunit